MTILRGVDVSFRCPGSSIKAAGMTFAISECSIGMGENASFRANLPDWKAQGLLVGVYHYCIYTKSDGSMTDPIAQADALADRIASLGVALDIPVLIDIEQPKTSTDLSLPAPPDKIVGWLEQFVSRLKERLGYFPGFYIYPAYAKMLGAALATSKTLGRCMLWLADYSHGVWPPEGTVGVICNPQSQWFTGGPWNEAKMMQTKGDTSVPGIPTIVDTNVFFGTADELTALARPPGPSILPPVPSLPGAAGAVVAPVVSGRAGFIALLVAGVVGAAWWVLQKVGKR